MSWQWRFEKSVAIFFPRGERNVQLLGGQRLSGRRQASFSRKHGSAAKQHVSIRRAVEFIEERRVGVPGAPTKAKFRKQIFAELNLIGRLEQDIGKQIVLLEWRRQNLFTYDLAGWARPRRSAIRSES
jgi:hypothetical protein